MTYERMKVKRPENACSLQLTSDILLVKIRGDLQRVALMADTNQCKCSKPPVCRALPPFGRLSTKLLHNGNEAAESIDAQWAANLSRLDDGVPVMMDEAMRLSGRMDGWNRKTKGQVVAQ